MVMAGMSSKKVQLLKNLPAGPPRIIRRIGQTRIRARRPWACSYGLRRGSVSDKTEHCFKRKVEFHENELKTQCRGSGGNGRNRYRWRRGARRGGSITGPRSGLLKKQNIPARRARGPRRPSA